MSWKNCVVEIKNSFKEVGGYLERYYRDICEIPLIFYIRMGIFIACYDKSVT